ncbi:MAG TPA: IS4 family transposase [Phycisphaerae bacterium]|nr:IS4 family transposase [Phycisphaerae bacterium]HRY71200.1 IS4 family transposase [Phycisphaerae bacterium]HSA29488.1 IS4 family transposase [Phycisphaerae bacterium]
MASFAYWRRHVNQDLLADPLLAAALSPENVESRCRSVGYRWRRSFWSPSITLVTFILQVLSAEKTLRAAVAGLLTRLVAQGWQSLPSADPAAYCQARQRLPGQVFTGLLAQTASRIRAEVKTEHRWLGHRVWIVDGSNASMPDTPALQAVFPQSSSQKAGCGFPIAQIVAIFCWSTGAIMEVAIDALRPHELSLFRRMGHHFQPGDVVLADRAYGGYVDMARLLGCGVDGVFRLHQGRSIDWRRGLRLERGDHLVTLHKPVQWQPSFGIGRRAF